MGIGQTLLGLICLPINLIGAAVVGLICTPCYVFSLCLVRQAVRKEKADEEAAIASASPKRGYPADAKHTLAELNAIAPSVAFKSLDSHILNQPSMLRGSELEYEGIPPPNRPAADAIVCRMCAGECKPEDMVRLLPCPDPHMYHTDCIDAKLGYELMCPLCLTDLSPSTVGAAEAHPKPKAAEDTPATVEVVDSEPRAAETTSNAAQTVANPTQDSSV